MKLRTPNQKITLSLTLMDGESNKFVRAYIFDQAGANVSPGSGYIDLTHLQGGCYTNLTDTAFFLADGLYLVLYQVFSDAGYSVQDIKYGNCEEDLHVTDFEQRILTEIPDNILLDNDARLDHLNTIPDLATSSQLNSETANIINTVNSNTDNSDGRAV